ncbi:MAG: hypothetical protein QOJ33_1179 [Chloroflexota bacterium]|jgi:hypothetical protein|nr:hypothetical protein [Chloroflexota bacterium]MEA2668245.1 hypothetical protein [Chloroflexota bacterium]
MRAPRKSGRARRTFSAGGVVYRQTAHGPEVALIKANGRWSLPKGSIEKGEKPEATALREILDGPAPSPLRTVSDYLVELSGDAVLSPQLDAALASLTGLKEAS